MRGNQDGEMVCDVPVKALTDEAPIYERPMRAQVNAGTADFPSAHANEARVRSSLDTDNNSSVRASALKADGTSALPANHPLLKLLSSPNPTSKECSYRHSHPMSHPTQA